MQEDITKKMFLLGKCGALGWLSTALQAGTIAVLVFRFARWSMQLPTPLKVCCSLFYFPLFYLVQAHCYRKTICGAESGLYLCARRTHR
jgi:dolichyl-phosphate-mannose--protein O-mannosyl transferase